MNKDFTTALIQELISGVYQDYSDNTDFERFGYPPLSQLARRRIKNKVKSFLLRKKILFVDDSYKNDWKQAETFRDHLGGLADLYGLLEDEYSRNLLIRIIAFRILGKTRVKLPLNTPEYWQKRREIKSFANQKDFVSIKFMNWKLFCWTLDKIGYPLKLYDAFIGVLGTFVFKQYQYGKIEPVLKAEKGDFVIDGGGCWGDTALYFAYEVGDKGKIYTFEFVPENLKIMKRNFTLNPQLKKRIEIIDNSLWEKSGNRLYCWDNGPGSRVSGEKITDEDKKITTVSIDDFVFENKVKKIDFIKLDIEGAEMKALQGAIKTIKKFKPKLALSLYHHLNDFYIIPKFINSLDLGYSFYLDHFTIHAEETILFAKPS